MRQRRPRIWRIRRAFTGTRTLTLTLTHSHTLSDAARVFIFNYSNFRLIFCRPTGWIFEFGLVGLVPNLFLFALRPKLATSATSATSTSRSHAPLASTTTSLALFGFQGFSGLLLALRFSFGVLWRSVGKSGGLSVFALRIFVSQAAVWWCERFARAFKNDSVLRSPRPPGFVRLRFG